MMKKNSLALVRIPFALVRAEEEFSIEKLNSDDGKNELNKKIKAQKRNIERYLT